MHFGRGIDQKISYSLDGGRLVLVSCDLRDKPYDIDLLYVECRACGKPVVWEKGKTSALVAASGVDVSLFDAHCMLLSDGCPSCLPDVIHFTLHLVRLTSFFSPELLLLGDCRGNA